MVDAEVMLSTPERVEENTICLTEKPHLVLAVSVLFRNLVLYSSIFWLYACRIMSPVFLCLWNLFPDGRFSSVSQIRIADHSFLTNLGVCIYKRAEHYIQLWSFPPADEPGEKVNLQRYFPKRGIEWSGLRKMTSGSRFVGPEQWDWRGESISENQVFTTSGTVEITPTSSRKNTP